MCPTYPRMPTDRSGSGYDVPEQPTSPGAWSRTEFRSRVGGIRTVPAGLPRGTVRHGDDVRGPAGSDRPGDWCGDRQSDPAVRGARCHGDRDRAGRGHARRVASARAGERHDRAGHVRGIAADRALRLVYAAAALHWTNPDGRWSRIAALLEPGGVFASFGGPIELADPVVAEAVRGARAPLLASDDIPSPDGTPPEHDMQWPGTELQRSGWFDDVRQSVIERRLTMSAGEYLGHLSTVSAYLELPESARQQVFDRIRQVLPDRVEIAADIVVHLARRRHQR